MEQGSKHLPTRGSVVTVTQLGVGGTYLFGASEADFEPYLPTYLWTAPRRIIAARARARALLGGAPRRETLP